MRNVPVEDALVLVLPTAPDAKAKGSLLESFLARLLASEYGFEEPNTSRLNVTSEGIEIDVSATHRLTNASAIAECKAYARNVAAHELTNFYGKLNVERFSDPDTFGIMFALPRLTAEGEEKARTISGNDTRFRYINAEDLSQQLHQGGLLSTAPTHLTETSDHAIVITEYGLFSAAIVLNPAQRTPQSIAVWGSNEVPDAVVELLGAADYAQGLPVLKADSGGEGSHAQLSDATYLPQLTQVSGSTSDFEYQLPASPKFFVGRKAIVEQIGGTLKKQSGTVFVLNAQSGWGKSSLALKARDMAARSGGQGFVFDTRTADGVRYLTEVLRKVALAGHDAGTIQLPEDPRWGSLESALATLRSSKWLKSRPIVVVFDQFENVFANATLTRSFRDLALGIREIPGPFIVGYAWKTDLVGWTEGHPFQLRDDIRGAGQVFLVDPFGAREVDVILTRLSKELDVKLLPDLRARLKAYSQGLPWLLKKLADHVLRQLREGETQEDLLAESLNVVALFEADLRELTPLELGVLKHVARYAPVPAAEVTEHFSPDPVQSLVDRRLLVQVGDRLDTYWDTFRDFLNTGNVPIQESWILRQTPNSVSRLLPIVMEGGGEATIVDLVAALGNSDRAVFNLSRELRLLGVSSYAPNKVRLVDEVVNAQDPESAMRRRVAASLRKHKAFSSLRDLAERSGGQATLDSYSRELRMSFPAVDVSPTAWTQYARAFLFWMEYAGLVLRQGVYYRPVNDAIENPTVKLLEISGNSRNQAGVLYTPAGPAIRFLGELGEAGGSLPKPDLKPAMKAVGALQTIAGVTVINGEVRLTYQDLVGIDGDVSKPALRALLLNTPAGSAGIDALRKDPGMSPGELGEIIERVSHHEWSPLTRVSVGSAMRSWAKAAGETLIRPPKGTT